MNPSTSPRLAYRKYALIVLMIPLVGLLVSTRITRAAKYDSSLALHDHSDASSGSNIFAGQWRGLFDSRFGGNRLFDGPTAVGQQPPTMATNFNPTSIPL